MNIFKKLFQYIGFRRAKAIEHKEAEPISMEYFIEFKFLNSDINELCQVSEAVLDNVKIELTKSDTAQLRFKTLMKNNCIINLEFVTAINIRRAPKLEFGSQTSDIYLRMYAHDKAIEIESDSMQLADELEKQPAYLKIGNRYINKQYLMMAAFS
jgi:hypothetical protein